MARSYSLKGFPLTCLACGERNFQVLARAQSLFDDGDESAVYLQCVACGKTSRFEPELLEEQDGTESRGPLI